MLLMTTTSMHLTPVTRRVLVPVDHAQAATVAGPARMRRYRLTRVRPALRAERGAGRVAPAPLSYD